jgi:hypothetical protein
VVISVDINKFLELNSELCKRAFHRLWMSGEGRYAYADDWNVLADCIQHIFNILDKLYQRWGDHAMANPHSIYVNKMFRQIRKLYMETIKCREIFSDYKRLQWGDTVTPEHTNVLIDTAKCLDDAAEKSPRRGEVALVDEDDWGSASSLIEDGTIVFVNFGTKAMSPVEVRYFLENYNVVFAILLGRHPMESGAFYNIFYTEPYVGWQVLIRDRFRLRKGAFFDSFGVYGCHESRGPDMPIGYLPAYFDPMVMGLYKIPNAVRWTWQYGVETEYQRAHLGGLDLPDNVCINVTNGIEPGEGRVIAHLNGVDIPLETLQAFAIAYLDRIVTLCDAKVVLEHKFAEQLEIEFERRPSIGADILYSWAYARIGKGAVIELPLHSVISDVRILDWYIGAIAHVLIGEPDKCFIGPMPDRLRRVVWMARRGAAFWGVPVNIPDFLGYWASLSKWRFIDLRTKKS